MKALITGITGQDGSYLAELLLEKGYEVHGMVRRVAAEHPKHRYWRISHLMDRLTIHDGSLESYGSIFNIVAKVKPDECYHLAAQSYVHTSFKEPFTTIKANIDGTVHVLEAIKNNAPECKVYFAASSEMFGKVVETPQRETTPFYPRSPYGVSKVAGFDITRNYRESYGIYACSGILFNHESPRRGEEFVTRKITIAAAKIALGVQNKLLLGNITSLRDWGYAPEYVEAMWLMLQQPEPRDFVIATGECNSVQDFLKVVFGYCNLNWENYVEKSNELYRPAEVVLLRGDASLAEKEMNWKPKVKMEELARLMAESDFRLVKAGKI